MSYYDDPHDIDRLDALDEIKSLRSLGYTDAAIGRELDGVGRDLLNELAAPHWNDDDSTDCESW